MMHSTLESNPLAASADKNKNLAEPFLVREPVDAPASEQAIPTIYHHTKRESWGRAVCIWNRDGRRAFQFEDGQLRVMAAGYASMLERVSLSSSTAMSVARDLQTAAGITLATRERRAAGEGPQIDLRQQVALFRDEYPEGFADEGWLKDVRGRDAARRKKGHRESAIAHAGELLNLGELDRLLEAMDGDSIMSRIREVLGKTNLVTKTDLAPLEHVHVTAAVAVGSTLRSLLAEDAPLEVRTRRFIDALTRAGGVEPRWQLVTALPALIDPAEHVWVRPAAIREQAKSVAPELHVSTQASGPAYHRIVPVVHKVARLLTEEGVAPHDLVDVADFMWATLRPAARKRFADLLASRRHAPDDEDAPTEPDRHAA